MRTKRIRYFAWVMRVMTLGLLTTASWTVARADEKEEEKPPVENTEKAGTDLASLGKGPWTGLVIDAVGLGIKRSMIPAIFDEKEKIVYPLISPDTPMPKEGWISYLSSRNQIASSRVGKSPLLVKALRKTGKADQSVIVANEVAQFVLDADAQFGFLKKMKVAFLVADDTQPQKPKTTEGEKVSDKDKSPDTKNPPEGKEPDKKPTSPAEERGKTLVIASVVSKPAAEASGDLQEASIGGGALTVRYGKFWQPNGDGDSFARLASAKEPDLTVWVEWKGMEEDDSLDKRAERQLTRQQEQSDRAERLPDRKIAGAMATQIAWA
ncbi:MAG: hypothetical protein HY318_09485, partial [Armatimonadetes bacterium]|nr:hypothetical protein [Armatimonadota bacterium]